MKSIWLDDNLAERLLRQKEFSKEVSQLGSLREEYRSLAGTCRCGGNSRMRQVLAAAKSVIAQLPQDAITKLKKRLGVETINAMRQVDGKVKAVKL